MAAWVSFSDWNGNGSPLGSHAHYVGLNNYRHLLTTPGLDQNNFGTSLRNNFYYVILVVPIQTAVALFLAVLVNRRVKGVGFFRTAFYFPSVTSSVAITVLFLFLFSPAGAINKLLSYVGVNGPAWLYDPRGLFHVILGQFGVHQPGSLTERHVPRRQLLGLGVRPEHRHVRLHHHGGLHDLRHVHAALPRCAAERRRVGQRGGRARRGNRVAQVPVHHRCR